MMTSMQIDHESSIESFDERRVNQLKAQLVQLERQAMVLTRALSGYKQKIHSAEGAIQQTLDLLTSSLQDSSGRGDVTLRRSDMSSQIKLLEDALQRVNASSAQSEDGPPVAKSYTPNTTFLKADHKVTIADVSVGTLKHLNLAQVTNLEQRLCKLYGNLCAFSLRQQQTLNDNDSNMAELLNSLQKACEHLQQLSFLVPTVPWAKRHCLEEVTSDDLMKALPKLTYAKHQDVKDLLTVVLKLAEHRYSLLLNKCKCLELDLGYLRGTDTKASAHVKSSSTGLLIEFSTYHESIKENLVTPLEVALGKFDTLSSSPTDENLRLFLQHFKECAPELLQVCEAISRHNFTDDVMNSSDSMYDKNIRKILKDLKLEKMKLEDKENELLQSEQETRDEVKSRISQLPNSSSKVKIKPFELSKSAPKRSTTTQPVSSGSAAAATFLSKYENVEKSLEGSQMPSKSDDTSVSSSKGASENPKWLQEMKDDLSAKSKDSEVSPASKTVGLAPRRSFKK